MTISVNFSPAVAVNGFSCRSPVDVQNAAQHIDPNHPRSGPFDRDAASDPTRPLTDKLRLASQQQQTTGMVYGAEIQVNAGIALGATLGTGSVVDRQA